ncbi:O-antigen ligase family protein [Mucilaginibacter sp.]
MLFSVIFTFFGSVVDIDVQLKQLITYLIQEFALGFMIWHVYKTKRQLNIFFSIVLTAIAVSSVYGIYCVLIGGSNPYIGFINLIYQPKFDALAVYSEIERGSLQGRLQATTGHPMIWAGYTTVLCFVCAFLIFKTKSKIEKVLFSALLFLVGANLIFTGTRSALLAVLLSLFFIVIFTSIRTKGILLFGVFLILLVGLDTSILGKYQDVADSVLFVWNQKKSESYNGSTVGMRINQLNGSVDIISDGSELFGKGYSWTQLYLQKNGDHPVLLAFESILFVVLIESGFFGLLLWIYWMRGLFKNISTVYRAKRQALGMDYRILQAYLISYITYILLTGINLTFYFFVIFYVVLLKYIMLNAQPQKIKAKENLQLTYEPAGL